MKLANGLRIGAEVLLGASIMVMLNVSMTKLFAGNRAGVGLLVPIAVFTLFMWLGWIHPMETGIGLILLGIIIAALSRIMMIDRFAWLMMGVSTLVTGFLLMAAGWKFRQIHEK